MTVTINPTEVSDVYGNDEAGNPFWNLRKAAATTDLDADQLISVPYIINYNPSTTNQGTNTLTINFNQTNGEFNFRG